ncbi:Zona pellucida-binding protein 2, partial [Dryobates pubescens]
MGILTVVLWSCSGQRVSPPWDSPAISNQEHQRGLVFIHTGSSLYSLPCSPAEMEVANVTYHWVQDKAVPKRFSVTREGHLLFRHFQASYSGMYSCTISYMKQGVPVSQTFHYSIFGYHVLGGLDILLLFHSKLCEDKLSRWFIRSLHNKLMLLKIEQHFQLQTISTFCFPPPHTSSDEFIFQVQLEVSLFGPHWDEDCNPQDTATLTDCYHTTVQHNI